MLHNTIETKRIESGICRLDMAEDIELNKISLHIYQGEALSVIGEPGSSKTLIEELWHNKIH